MALFLLLLSIGLSTGRNLLSKNMSGITFGTKQFFHRQAILFGSGAGALILFGNMLWRMPSLQTLVYAVIYAILLIFAQWFYTAALGNGNTALCSTVYSMGFILPTLSGTLIWSEPFSALDLAGILCAAAAVCCSGSLPKQNKNTDKRYFLPLLIAMLASGGLGIMQKMQQKSIFSEERAMFLLMAFLLAALGSLIASYIIGNEYENTSSKSTQFMAAGAGIAFGSCNLLNTALAGMLPSVVFFPVLNIGVILLTMLCSIIILNEQVQKRDAFVLILGGMSILLLNMG